MMIGIGWLKRRKQSKVSERIERMKRTVAPFHQVLSTLRAEGGKKSYLAGLVLKDIQERERSIGRLDELRRKLAGAK